MKKHILFLSLFIFVFASCDEGRLYQDRLIVPEEGRVVKLHVNMSGVDTWPDGYTVVLAGFNNEKEYSLIAKSIPNNGDVDLLMAGIGEEVTSIELCVTNRIRERVYSFTRKIFYCRCRYYPIGCRDNRCRYVQCRSAGYFYW